MITVDPHVHVFDTSYIHLYLPPRLRVIWMARNHIDAIQGMNGNMNAITLLSTCVHVCDTCF